MDKLNPELKKGLDDLNYEIDDRPEGCSSHIRDNILGISLAVLVSLVVNGVMFAEVYKKWRQLHRSSEQGVTLFEGFNRIDDAEAEERFQEEEGFLDFLEVAVDTGAVERVAKSRLVFEAERLRIAEFLGKEEADRRFDIATRRYANLLKRLEIMKYERSDYEKVLNELLNYCGQMQLGSTFVTNALVEGRSNCIGCTGLVGLGAIDLYGDDVEVFSQRIMRTFTLEDGVKRKRGHKRAVIKAEGDYYIVDAPAVRVLTAEEFEEKYDVKGLVPLEGMLENYLKRKGRGKDSSESEEDVDVLSVDLSQLSQVPALQYEMPEGVLSDDLFADQAPISAIEDIGGYSVDQAQVGPDEDRFADLDVKPEMRGFYLLNQGESLALIEESEREKIAGDLTLEKIELIELQSDTKDIKTITHKDLAKALIEKAKEKGFGTIDLSGLEGIDPHALEELAKSGLNLKIGLELITDADAEVFAQNMEPGSKLVFTDLRVLGADAAKALANGKYRKLDIEVDSIEGEVFGELGKFQGEALSVTNVENLSDDDMRKFQNSNIRELNLDIKSFGRWSNGALDVLIGMLKLETLRIRFPKEVNPGECVLAVLDVKKEVEISAPSLESGCYAELAKATSLDLPRNLVLNLSYIDQGDLEKLVDYSGSLEFNLEDRRLFMMPTGWQKMLRDNRTSPTVTGVFNLPKLRDAKVVQTVEQAEAIIEEVKADLFDDGIELPYLKHVSVQALRAFVQSGLDLSLGLNRLDPVQASILAQMRPENCLYLAHLDTLSPEIATILAKGEYVLLEITAKNFSGKALAAFGEYNYPKGVLRLAGFKKLAPEDVEGLKNIRAKGVDLIDAHNQAFSVEVLGKLAEADHIHELRLRFASRVDDPNVSAVVGLDKADALAKFKGHLTISASSFERGVIDVLSNGKIRTLELNVLTVTKDDVVELARFPRTLRLNVLNKPYSGWAKDLIDSKVGDHVFPGDWSYVD